MSTPTVFVVDDDRSMRVSLDRLLRSAGWPVLVFASAEEFLALGHHLTGGCLIADVHLGRMSGLELQAHLAGIPGTVPVILTSGFDEAAAEAEAMRLGALAYLRKPFDAEVLLDSVKRGMEQGVVR